MSDPLRRIHFLRLVHQEALRAHLEPELVLAVIQIESRFDRFAISRVGAQGYMQIMPFWLKEIGDPQGNLFDPTDQSAHGLHDPALLPRSHARRLGGGAGPLQRLGRPRRLSLPRAARTRRTLGAELIGALTCG
jgi:Soluble lytic murein transglycosylase and related regulatory proteins (some contain LysM/invasin domains)